MKEYLIIHPADNVGIALKNLSPGLMIRIGQEQFVLKDEIPCGHKFALRKIAAGEHVLKYGSPIGHTTQPVRQGEHIHVENTKTNLSGTIGYRYIPRVTPLPPAKEKRSFKGYKRSNGEAGIRNELWIVPTVGCVNGQAEQIIRRFLKRNRSMDIDHVHVFKHSYGCSQLGDDHTNTQKALARLIKHPNAGGVLVLGLGCENNQISQLKTFIGDYDPARIKFLVAQEVEDEVEEGLKLFEEIYEQMRHDHREEIPLSALKVGLKCGGS
ncbi:MAG: UxaA family hydrolase, partial [Mangrovibacterium sp.]